MKIQNILIVIISGLLASAVAGCIGPTNPPGVDIPGDATNALTVASSKINDRLSDFSSWGPTDDDRTKPEISAPGEEIIAPRAIGTSMGEPINYFYTIASGTSMATPQVAGSAALLIQASRAEAHGKTATGIKAALMNSATPMRDESGMNYSEFGQGKGLINVSAAYNELKNNRLTATTPSKFNTVNIYARFKIVLLNDQPLINISITSENWISISPVHISNISANNHTIFNAQINAAGIPLPLNGTIVIRDHAGIIQEIPVNVFTLEDTYEQDDTINQAKWVQLGERQTHNFNPAGDHDWIKFNGTQGKSYIIKTAKLGNVADTVMYLYDNNGNQLTYNDDSGGSRASKISFIPTFNSTYYIMVKDYGEDATGTNAFYDFSVVTSEVMDSYEPDDTYTQARRINLNETQNHNFNPSGDQDWIKFYLTSGINYTIETSNLENMVDTVMCLYYTDGSTILSCDDDSGEGLASRITGSVTSNGIYYAMVNEFDDNAYGPDTGYNISFSISRSLLTETSGQLANITLSPSSASISSGQTRQFTATGKDANGIIVNITTTWSSSNNTIGNISSSGLFTAIKTGRTIVTATSGSISRTANVTVAAGQLANITLSPSSASISSGQSQQFTATGRDANGNIVNITTAWSSSNNTFGNISSSGMFTAKKAGSAIISASYNGTTGIETITVTPGNLSLVIISLFNTSIIAGQTQNITANGYDANGNAVSIIPEWSSSNTTVGAITSSGLFTASSAGTTTIIAINGSVSGKLTVTVTVVTPTSTSIPTPTTTPTPTPTVTPTATPTPTPVPTINTGLDIVSRYAGTDGIVQRSEAVQAVIDYFGGVITKQEAISVVMAYFGG